MQLQLSNTLLRNHKKLCTVIILSSSLFRSVQCKTCYIFFPHESVQQDLLQGSLAVLLSMLVSLHDLGRMSWGKAADWRVLLVLLGQEYLCQHVPVDTK